MKKKPQIENFSEKKCKNFGYTFTLIFFTLTVYDYYFYSFIFIFYFFVGLSFLFFSIFKPRNLRFFGFYWERFGFFLGKFFSPIILTMVYVLTILPINMILRILNIDLIGVKFSKKKKVIGKEELKRILTLESSFNDWVFKRVYYFSN